MKRPYHFLQLVLLFLILSSIVYPQSGVAKSLEIGNQWVYKNYGGFYPDISGDTTIVEIQRDTLINDTTWAVIGYNFQRADSNSIYNYFSSYPVWSIIDFSRSNETVYAYGKNRRRIERYFEIPTMDHHKWIYIEGIGLVEHEQWYDNYFHRKTLVACRINGVDYGDTTLLDVEHEINRTIPENFKLSQNHPNPFNPTTQISYEIPQDSDAELSIYNILGKEIIKLVDTQQPIGKYYINWNGQNSMGEQVPGGVYFYTLRTKDFTKTRKMLLLR